MFRGGVTVGTGDIERRRPGRYRHGGRAEAADRTSSSTTRAALGILRSVFAYDINFTGGVFVAMGDVNGDGFDDLITGPGVGGAPTSKFRRRQPASSFTVS